MIIWRNITLFFASVIGTVTSCITLQAQVQADNEVVAEQGQRTELLTVANINEALEFLPQTVASYDGRIITADDVRKIISGQVGLAQEKGQPIPAENFRQRVINVLNFLIDRELLLKAAEADGFEPAVADARRELSHIADSMGEEELIKHLQTQRLSRQEAEQRRAEELAINRWIQAKVAPAAKVTEDDARLFYQKNGHLFDVPESIQIAHIFLKKPEDSEITKNAELKAKASELSKQLKNGASFEKLAKENSDCPSRIKGGDLGFLAPEEMSPEFRDAASNLQQGEISDVVETKFGFHILKRGEKCKSQKLSFDEVKDKLLSNLIQNKIQDILAERVQELRNQFHVEVFLNGK